jgi:hypothetical protein
VTKTDRYFIGQGEVLIGVRGAAGAVTAGWVPLGNVPELRLTNQVDRVEHNESRTGKRNKDLVIETVTNVMANMVLESWDRENLALVLYGTASSIAGATVSAEAVTAPSALGTYVPLANINLTSFTSLTSSPAGTTHVNGTDYRVDLKSGTIFFPTGSAIAPSAPLLANYVAGNAEKIVAMNANPKEYWLRFNGLNTAEDDTPVVIDVFRAKLRETEDLSLIGNEVGQLSIMADVLFDGAQADGPYYRIRQARQSA